MDELNCQQEVDVALGPFVIRLERQDIGIGGIMGTLESSMLIKYPQSVYKSVYGTVEPFDLEVQYMSDKLVWSLVNFVKIPLNYINTIRFGSE